jgi:hypothetical protein
MFLFYTADQEHLTTYTNILLENINNKQTKKTPLITEHIGKRWNAKADIYTNY